MADPLKDLREAAELYRNTIPDPEPLIFPDALFDGLMQQHPREFTEVCTRYDIRPARAFRKEGHGG